MTGWGAGPMLGFDLETTGIDVESDRVVSAACVLDGAVTPQSVRTWLAAVEVPPDATAVHGITTAYAMAFGRPERETVDLVAGELALACVRGIPIVGMNLAYDLTLLDRRCAALGVPTLCDRVAESHRCPEPVIDVMVLDKMVDRYRKGPRRLASLVDLYLGRLHVGAHDAVSDVIASINIAREMAHRPTWVAQLGLNSLHTRQLDARAEQQRSLLAHFRGLDPDTTARCDPCWPVCHGHDRPPARTTAPALPVDLPAHPDWDDLPATPPKGRYHR